MENITSYETYLKYNGINEQALKGGSKSFIRDIAAQNGVDPEELLKMVQDDLEEDGVMENKINEWIGGESIATISDFFVIFPSVVFGLVGLGLGVNRLKGWVNNKIWIKAEAEQRVKAMIKKDGTLIDKYSELIDRVTQEILNDPVTKAKLDKAKWEGGLLHPSHRRTTYNHISGGHVFGSGE